LKLNFPLLSTQEILLSLYRPIVFINKLVWSGCWITLSDRLCKRKEYRFELENVSIYHSLSALGVTQSVHAKICIGMHPDLGQILNFQNTFDRVCDKIRMETQIENFFGSLISEIKRGGVILLRLRFRRNFRSVSTS
jgi:hypothetical protein